MKRESTNHSSVWGNGAKVWPYSRSGPESSHSRGSVGADVVAHDTVLPLCCRHVDGCKGLPSATGRLLLCVCVSICVCVCIVLYIHADKEQRLYHPRFTCIWPKLPPGVKYDLSAAACAQCRENKDVYWAVHSFSLFANLQPYLLTVVVLLIKWIDASCRWHNPTFSHSLSKLNLLSLYCGHISDCIQLS